MTAFTILGTGTMAQAIHDVLRRGGHDVQPLGSTDTDQPISGEIVVLAVPHVALDSILSARGSQLSGKVVVDMTPPVDYETLDSLSVPADGSTAAGLAEALPEARVLKASFNTTFAATLASGRVGDNPTTVLVAGDDAEAKEQLMGVISQRGLGVVDAGSLRRARDSKPSASCSSLAARRRRSAGRRASPSSADHPEPTKPSNLLKPRSTRSS